MFVVNVRSPQGDLMEILSTPDETFARGAQAGINEILKALAPDLDLEEGYNAEIEVRAGAASPTAGSQTSFWNYHGGSSGYPK